MVNLCAHGGGGRRGVAEFPVELPVSVTEGMTVTFGVAGANADNAAEADQESAEERSGIGDVAEETPAEESGEDHDSVVEGRELGCARVTVGQDDEVLGGGEEDADAQEQTPLRVR